MRRFPWRLLAAPALWLVSAGHASAHAFRTDAGEFGYEAFLDGTGAVTSDIAVIIAAVACGLILGYQPRERALWSFPVLIAAMVAGCILSRSGTASALPPASVVALAVALAIAARPALPPALASGLVAVSGFWMSWTVFAGHPTDTIAALAWPGALFALYVIAAGSGAVVQISRERLAAPWLDIVWRAFASWIAAICVMVIAFALAVPQ